MNKCHDPCRCETKDELNIIAKGDPGKSAYDIAVDQGFVGTPQEFIESLHGKDANIDIATKEDIDMILSM